MFRGPGSQSLHIIHSPGVYIDRGNTPTSSWWRLPSRLFMSGTAAFCVNYMVVRTGTTTSCLRRRIDANCSCRQMYVIDYIDALSQPYLIPIPVVISHHKSVHLHKSSWTIDHGVLAIPARSANTKPHTSNLTFGLFNIRSLTNKGPLLFDLQNDHKFDFFCLTETWQQPHDFSDLNQTIPPGFVYSSQPRTSGRGGGLAILYNQICKVSSITVPVYPSFESIALQIKGPTPTILATIDQPLKPNNAFLQEFSAFLQEFSALLTTLCFMSPNLYS